MSLKLGDTNIAGTQVLYSTTGSNTDGAMTQTATTTQLSLKANDTDVVHKTGDETINGTKTFTNTLTAQRFKGNNGLNTNCDFEFNNGSGWYLSGNSLTSGTWQQILTVKSTSKNTNGYLKFDNGIIIQWGRVTSVSSASATVTLPTAFSNTNYSMTGSCNYDRSTSDGHGYVYNQTSTTFQIKAVDPDMLPFRWVAIGY